MVQHKKSKLAFNGVDILETTLNIKRRFNFEEKINLTTAVFKLGNISDEGDFKIIMEVVLKAEGYFDMSVKGMGLFRIEGIWQEKEQKNFIDTNAPAIMFPYIRSFISTLSANSGHSLPNIVIPPQFFQGELEEMKEK
ncbi:MAG: hypothetical protein RLZZ292_3183 [Bacteroidota bacterium]|jgi:preprotein translocase subunit SecB